MTAGFDNKTKVWNLVPALHPLQEGARGAPRLLATLTDHFAAVNVARFSRCGAQKTPPLAEAIPPSLNSNH